MKINDFENEIIEILNEYFSEVEYYDDSINFNIDLINCRFHNNILIYDKCLLKIKNCVHFSNIEEYLIFYEKNKKIIYELNNFDNIILVNSSFGIYYNKTNIMLLINLFYILCKNNIKYNYINEYFIEHNKPYHLFYYDIDFAIKLHNFIIDIFDINCKSICNFSNKYFNKNKLNNIYNNSKTL